MDTVLLIGLIGMVIILVAFALNVLKFVKATDKSYLLLNCVGSGVLIYYGILLDNNIPIIVLNTVWAGTAIWGLIKSGK